MRGLFLKADSFFTFYLNSMGRTDTIPLLFLPYPYDVMTTGSQIRMLYCTLASSIPSFARLRGIWCIQFYGILHFLPIFLTVIALGGVCCFGTKPPLPKTFYVMCYDLNICGADSFSISRYLNIFI